MVKIKEKFKIKRKTRMIKDMHLTIRGKDSYKTNVEILKNIGKRIIVSSKDKDRLLTALPVGVSVRVKGNVRDYFAALNNGALIEAEGNVGDYVGDSATSGEIYIDCCSGFGAGSYMAGGSLFIGGDVGDNLAQMNKGAHILVVGNAGNNIGLYMLGGRVIVLGNAGNNIGNYMIRGEIFVCGTVASLGANAKQLEATKSEVEMINELLKVHNIKAIKSCKKILPINEKFFG